MNRATTNPDGTVAFVDLTALRQGIVSALPRLGRPGSVTHMTAQRKIKRCVGLDQRMNSSNKIP
jgi:hypothetical protein